MKDKITNVCGLAIAVSGGILTAEKAGVQLPSAITTSCILVSAVALATIGWFTGKPNQ